MKPRSFRRIWKLIIQVASVRNKQKRLNKSRYAIEAIAKDGRMIFKGVKSLKAYEAWVRFGTRVRVQDSIIFEKGGCGCSGTRQLKNYLKYFYLYF